MDRLGDLGAGEMLAEAHMDAAAEGEIAVVARQVGVEDVGIFECVRIATRGRCAEGEEGADRNMEAVIVEGPGDAALLRAVVTALETR